jgi:tRNA(fMet)-specific endonuclease VapC
VSDAGKTLLATDILSSLMRGTPSPATRAGDYVGEYGQFTISLVTRFEVLRGLKAKRASSRKITFDRFRRSNKCCRSANKSSARHPTSMPI